WWQAVYSGDPATNTGGSTSDCTSEPLTVNSPNVSIVKSTDTPKVNAGATIHYTLTITNAGPGTATNVSVSDTLPTNAGTSWTITGGDSTHCSINAAGTLLTCSYASFAPGTATVTISSPTTTATCGFVNNSATVTSGNDGGNTSGPIQIEVDCPTTLTTLLSSSSIDAGGSVSDQATISGAAPTAGGTITYKVYTNNTCDSAVFADATPVSNTVVNGVAPASKSITFPSGGSFWWQAVYSGDPATNTGGSTSDCTSQPLTVNSPNVSIVESTDTPKVNAGATIHYTLTITNAGPGTATNVSVSDTLPTNAGTSWTITGGDSTHCSINAAGTLLTCSYASFAPGTATVTISSPTTTATCGFVNNSATVTSGNDGGNTSGPIQIEVDCPTTLTTLLSSSSIDAGGSVSDQATISGAAPTAGGTITYKVYTNNTCDSAVFADATPVSNTVVNGVAPASK